MCICSFAQLEFNVTIMAAIDSFTISIGSKLFSAKLTLMCIISFFVNFCMVFVPPIPSAPIGTKSLSLFAFDGFDFQTALFTVTFK